MIKYVGDKKVDLAAMAKQLDEAILRMEADTETLDCTPAEREKFRKDIAKLKSQAGLA